LREAAFLLGVGGQVDHAHAPAPAGHLFLYRCPFHPGHVHRHSSPDRSDAPVGLGPARETARFRKTARLMREGETVSRQGLGSMFIPYPLAAIC